MTPLMEKLLRAQKLLLQHPQPSAEHQAVLSELREAVPAPLLGHFLRLIAQQRKGVALVRHGVCSECHLRVALAMVAVLARSDDLHLCENCGCYLVLQPEDAPPPPPAKPVVRRKRREIQPVMA